jgi:hypothetical protein
MDGASVSSTMVGGDFTGVGVTSTDVGVVSSSSRSPHSCISKSIIDVFFPSNFEGDGTGFFGVTSTFFGVDSIFLGKIGDISFTTTSFFERRGEAGFFGGSGGGPALLSLGETSGVFAGLGGGTGAFDSPALFSIAFVLFFLGIGLGTSSTVVFS